MRNSKNNDKNRITRNNTSNVYQIQMIKQLCQVHLKKQQTGLKIHAAKSKVIKVTENY